MRSLAPLWSSVFGALLLLGIAVFLTLGVVSTQRGLAARDSADARADHWRRLEQRTGRAALLAAELWGQQVVYTAALKGSGDAEMAKRDLLAAIQRLGTSLRGLEGLEGVRAAVQNLARSTSSPSGPPDQTLEASVAQVTAMLRAKSEGVSLQSSEAIRAGRELDGALVRQVVAFSSGVALCLALMLVLLLVGAGQRRKLIQRLEWQARTDGLTGVLNRRAWDEGIRLMVARAQRSGQTLSLVMLDLDHFKKFNDTYGHAAGDKLLRVVAQSLQRSTRMTDLVARYGGEEFALALEGCSAEDAQALLERVKGQLPEGRSFSAGIVETGGELSASAALERADRALYRAKREGRNRVLIAASTATRDTSTTLEVQPVG